MELFRWHPKSHPNYGEVISTVYCISHGNYTSVSRQNIYILLITKNGIASFSSFGKLLQTVTLYKTGKPKGTKQCFIMQ